jgi:hypothetical protein
VLRKYREIVVGILFGLGACLIDTVMHARMMDRTFWDEALQPRPEMLFYRGLFLAFGFTVGLLLWQKSRRERDFRCLADLIQRFQRELVSPVVLIHAHLQVLLTQEDFHLSPETEVVVRLIYEKSQQIQSLAKELPPPA